MFTIFFSHKSYRFVGNNKLSFCSICLVFYKIISFSPPSCSISQLYFSYLYLLIFFIFLLKIAQLAWYVHLFGSALVDHEDYCTVIIWQLPWSLILRLLLVAIYVETCRTPYRTNISCFLDFMFCSFVFVFFFIAWYKLKWIFKQSNFCLSFELFIS